MQEVDLPVINNTECEGMYRDAGYVEHIPNIFICAGYAAGGKDSCEVIISIIFLFDSARLYALFSITPIGENVGGSIDNTVSRDYF